MTVSNQALKDSRARIWNIMKCSTPSPARGVNDQTLIEVFAEARAAAGIAHHNPNYQVGDWTYLASPGYTTLFSIRRGAVLSMCGSSGEWSTVVIDPPNAPAAMWDIRSGKGTTINVEGVAGPWTPVLATALSTAARDLQAFVDSWPRLVAEANTRQAALERRRAVQYEKKRRTELERASSIVRGFRTSSDSTNSAPRSARRVNKSVETAIISVLVAAGLLLVALIVFTA